MVVPLAVVLAAVCALPRIVPFVLRLRLLVLVHCEGHGVESPLAPLLLLFLRLLLQRQALRQLQ